MRFYVDLHMFLYFGYYIYVYNKKKFRNSRSNTCVSSRFNLVTGFGGHTGQKNMA